MNVNLLKKILEYEKGLIVKDSEEEICLFQQMINEGLDWKKYGKYGKRAVELINTGKITSDPQCNLVSYLTNLFD